MTTQSPSSDEHTSPGLDDALQREIDAAMGDQSIEQLIEQSLSPPPESSPQDPAATPETSTPAAAQSDRQQIHHDVRRGRIAAIRGEDVFVELTGGDSKLQGVVPLQQFDRPPRLGSIMDFVVDRIDDGEGLVYLSREGAVSRATWEQLTRGAMIEARATAVNKGGLDLEMIGGIRAFMPASQIDIHHVDDLEQFVGQKLEAVVQEIDRKSKCVVLSRRQILQERQVQARAKTLAQIEVGQIREGKVTSLAKFGAFVDLGGVDGLIHVTDLSYSHVDQPGDLVEVGQTLQVKVLKVDLEKDRISLGLKQVQTNPWVTLGDRIKVADQVAGRVLRTANFGAFVEIEAGIEGLLPISELSWKRIHKPEEVITVGEVLQLKVLSIDPARQRLSVSLKQSQGDPWVGAERKFAAHSLVEGKVIATTDFGAFIELETGVEGLVHISELSAQRVGQVTDVLKIGETRPFRVLEVSEDDRKIRLSLKQVEQPHEQPTKEHAKPQATAQRRKRPDNLKGGMDVGGVGLGGLSLDDIK